MNNPVTLKIVQSIIKFLNSQVESGTLSEESVESVEVALQCLGSAYSLGGAEELTNAANLLDLFTGNEPPLPTYNKDDAEKFKNLGNTLMKENKFMEAVEAYTSAIQADSTNAIYYCNRAAAHSRLNNNTAAISDCKMAVNIDPTYSKAYGRLGFSYSSLGKHSEARESYLKACELEPENESYKSNLQLAEQQIQQGETAPSAAGFDLNSFMQNRGIMNIASQMLQNPNLRSVMQNPVLRNAASQMLQNPNMQSVISDLIYMGADESSVENIVDVSRELAEQMQAGNPDFMETLRREVSNILETNVQNENTETNEKKE